LPLPIKNIIDRPFADPLVFNPDSVALSAYQPFKSSENYKLFGLIPTWKALALEEKATRASEDGPKKDAGGPTVAFRYASGEPAVVFSKVEAGEVAVVTTSADPGRKEGQGRPTWTMFSTKEFGRVFVPFLDMTLNYLLHGQTEVHNVIAGKPFEWHPPEKELCSYTLLHPDGRKERLGLPDTKSGRPTLTASGLDRAGVYFLEGSVPNQEEKADASLREATFPRGAKELPIAVAPDPRESEDLTSLSNDEIDSLLGFKPVHITAGAEGMRSGSADRLNREWTLWLLTAVLFLALGETVLAYWCGRSW
jgi:hypothetical protein